MKIFLELTKQQKKEGTKTVWETIYNHTEQIDERTYGLLANEDTLKSFRRMGGSEYSEYGYTCNGYKMVKLLSTCPSKERRTIREFEFKTN